MIILQDGHGYHSEPVPEFIHPGSSKDAYRQRRKSNEKNPMKKNNFEKKPTGMGKKIFSGPKEQRLFSNQMLNPSTALEAPANEQQTAFNEMLGFNPFSPPDIMKDHSSVGSVSSDSTSTSQYVQQSTPPSPISKPYFSRRKQSKKNKKYHSAVSSDNARVSSKEVPKLAFDLDSGRVYDEKTGKWYHLVAD